ncbi:MAG: GNAT family N-acetyltransferase [Proteobacteria bacterium]|nr:GNAT family N-acetyltransferase [Pseudomonadota bacterium]
MPAPSPPPVRIHVAQVDAASAPEVRALRAAPEQTACVGDHAFNLLDAERDPLSEPMAVFAGPAVVGFYRLDFAPNAIAGRSLGAPSVGLRAMLIDARMQGRGYGTRAVRACCADLRRRHPRRRVLALAVHRGNRAALAAYRRAGFLDSGEQLAGGDAGPQQLLLYWLHGSAQGDAPGRRPPAPIDQSPP